MSIMKNKDVIIEVTQEEYDQQIKSGLTDEEILKPGKHKFRRGGFKERFPDYSKKDSKARINIYIDLEILEHFRNRAAVPNAAPYQTQINSELREVMKRDLEERQKQLDETAKLLLEDEDFLNAVSEKLKEKELQAA